MGETREVTDKYKKLQKEFKFKEHIWSVIHYGLGISAVILAFLATKISMAELSYAAGLIAAILTFLSPASRRKAYTEGCDLLRVNRQRYETQSDFDVKELNDGVEKAQAIITKR
jgi:hypothetical protein